MRRAMVVLVVAVLIGATGCLPAGFVERTVLQALVEPTSMAVAPDGRVFVTEKRGTIQTFDSVTDTSPSLFADLREQVKSTNDQGLLAIEVDPGWPARPYVFVHFTYDAPPGGTAPTYGQGTDTDPCPNEDCPGQQRVARLTSTVSSAPPAFVSMTTLISNVCAPTAYHAGGGLALAPDGSLYASFGDASWPYDGGFGYGDETACGDPVAEQGWLRSQDLRTGTDPVGLSGTVIRINPDTGAPWPGNPLAASPDVNAQRIVAYGLRNPFRIALRPGTNEVWIADVGSEYAEEIDRLVPTAPVENFGWPCYEGVDRQPIMDALDRPACEGLYLSGGAVPPVHAVCHAPTPPGEPCAEGGAALSALAFYPGGDYPSRYDGALFYGDYTKGQLDVLLAPTGVPDPSQHEVFGTDLGPPVELQPGPDGDLFYLDIFFGRVQRIHFGDLPPSTDEKPVAVIDQPVADQPYVVGQPIAFSGRAFGPWAQDLPPSTMRWSLIQRHCPTETTCHRHFVDSREGVASGSFIAVDHERPSTLEISLTVTFNGVTDVASVVLKRP